MNALVNQELLQLIKTYYYGGNLLKHHVLIFEHKIILRHTADTRVLAMFVIFNKLDIDYLRLFCNFKNSKIIISCEYA